MSPCLSGNEHLASEEHKKGSHMENDELIRV